MKTYKQPDYVFGVVESFYIKGRGECIIVDLKKEGFNLQNKDLRDKFMNKVVIYKGKPNKIIGFEYQGGPEREVIKTAFLLKQII